MKKLSIFFAGAVLLTAMVFSACNKDGTSTYTTDAAETTKSEIKEDITEALTDASENISDIGDDISEGISDAGENASEGISDVSERMAEKLSEARESLKSNE